MAATRSVSELGNARILHLLMQYSIPAIVGTAASSLYNIIDRIFIGHGVGPLAISGLALTFPLMNFAAAFGSLVGAGASTLVSIRLGEKNRKEATMILGNALFLNLVIGISLSIILLLSLDHILILFGASERTLPYARDFMQIILAGNVLTHIYLGLNNIMRASGFPKKAMTMTLTTVGVNLALAPVFIFVMNWGIRGAALATLSAQLVGTIGILTHFFKRSSPVRFLPGYFRLNGKIIKDIFSIGMSNFAMLSCAAVIVILFNRSLGHYGGDYAIGAYGIINGLMMLFGMIVIGFNQGMQPISGYNFGAKKYDRMFKVYKLTVICASCVMGVGFVLAQAMPHYLAGAFTDNKELIDLSVIGLRFGSIMFPIVGFQMVTANFFQSIGKAKISMMLALSRQVLFLIPALLIIPTFMGLTGIWLSLPVADFCSFLVTFNVLRYQYKKMKKELFI
jgi:putative MATE family efflux protein